MAGTTHPLEVELDRLGEDAPDALWQVYADMLLERGDPRGEIVALSLAVDAAESEAQAEKLARRAETLQLRLDRDLLLAARDAETFELEWARGFVRRARVTERWDAVRGAELLTRLFASDAARFVHTLVLDRHLPDDVAMGTLGDKGIVDWAKPALAGRTVPQVHHLHLGTEPDENMYLRQDSSFMFTTAAPGTPGARICRPYPYVGDPSAILRATPNLASLRITGACLSLDGSALPSGLRRLTIETRFLRASVLEAIGDARLGELESLELWLGHWPDSAPRFEGTDPETYFGRRTGPADLAKILSGVGLPKLRHLGLTNCAWMADAVAAVAESPLAAQLESLDFSYGFMRDDQARSLVRNRARFAKLRRLDLSCNQVRSSEVVADLQAAFGPTLLLGAQDDLEGNAAMALLAFPDS